MLCYVMLCYVKGQRGDAKGLRRGAKNGRDALKGPGWQAIERRWRVTRKH